MVGGFNLPLLKNDGVKVSWDDEIPNFSWKVSQNSMVPNHQPKKRDKTGISLSPISLRPRQ